MSQLLAKKKIMKSEERGYLGVLSIFHTFMCWVFSVSQTIIIWFVFVVSLNIVIYFPDDYNLGPLWVDLCQ